MKDTINTQDILRCQILAIHTGQTLVSTLTQPLGDVTDFAPVDVMADVVTLVLLHVVALGHRHWLTLLSLGVNTDLVTTYGVLCLMSTIYLSRDVLTLLPGLLLRHLDTAGLRLRLTNLLRHHPTLLYRLLQAELLWLLYLDREADLTTSVSVGALSTSLLTSFWTSKHLRCWATVQTGLDT